MAVYRSPLKHNKLLKEANALFGQLPFYMQYDIDIKMGLTVPDDQGDCSRWDDIEEEEYD